MDLKKFKLNKLVRENTEADLQKEGIKCNVKELARGRYLYQLKYKLIEEAREVLKSNSKKNLTEELGDTFEAFSLILKENNIAMSDILKAIDNKKETRGAITNLFIGNIEIPANSPLVDKYLKAGYKIIEDDSNVDTSDLPKTSTIALEEE